MTDAMSERDIAAEDLARAKRIAGDIWHACWDRGHAHEPIVDALATVRADERARCEAERVRLRDDARREERRADKFLVQLNVTRERLDEAMSRAESGAVQFGDDWPGTFLRGDVAGPLAMMVSGILDDVEAGRASSPFQVACVRNMLGLLSSSIVHEGQDVVRLRPFAECAACEDDPSPVVELRAEVERPSRLKEIEDAVYQTKGRVTQYDEPWRSMVVYLLQDVHEQHAEVEQLRMRVRTWRSLREAQDQSADDALDAIWDLLDADGAR